MAKLIKTTTPPKLYMYADAYVKMGALINECKDEIGWFGTVDKVEDGYAIKDIFVSPQVVSDARVTSDEEEERKWRDSLDDDTYNSLRFHGHSHVNMAVSPSPVDESYREEIIRNIPKDGFFIFLIGNKRGELNIEVYDLAQNIVFDTKECPLHILTSNGASVEDYVAESMKNVTTRAATVVSKSTVVTPVTKDKNEKWAGGKSYKSKYESESVGYYDGDEWWQNRYKDPYYGR